MLKKILLLLALIIPGFVPGVAPEAKAQYDEPAGTTYTCRRRAGTTGAFSTLAGQTTFAACKAHLVPSPLEGWSGTQWTFAPASGWYFQSITPSVAPADTDYCAEGYELDSLTGGCVGEPPPENPCDIGFVPGPFGECVPVEPPDSCEVVLGYVNGQEICQDDRNACEATGGYYGTINDQAVCIPPEDEPQTCAPGTFLFLDTSEGDFGFACVRPDESPPGDDTPDPNDPDDDGQTNDVDDDDDGDGTNDVDDGFSEVAAGAGQCDPTAQDYAACLNQVETVSATEAQTITTKLNNAGDSQLAKIGAAATQAIGTGDAGIDGPSDLESAITGVSVFQGFGCVDTTWSIMGSPLTISCVRTEPFRDILGYLFALLTLVSVFNIATQKGPN